MKPKPLPSGNLEDLMPKFNVMRRVIEPRAEEKLPPFDPGKCTCSACGRPPCGYCTSGEYAPD